MLVTHNIWLHIISYAVGKSKSKSKSKNMMREKRRSFYFSNMGQLRLREEGVNILRHVTSRHVTSRHVTSHDDCHSHPSNPHRWPPSVLYIQKSNRNVVVIRSYSLFPRSQFSDYDDFIIISISISKS